MRKKSTRLLSAALAVCMMLSVLPVGAFAAALIDQCGLRGYRHGGAAVSEKHCGFVVNLGGATCADVLALCDEVRAVVKEKTGYDLEKEIRVVKA